MARRRWGDRRDGKVIRDIDSMHYIMPLMYPNRCDNEAFMTLHINLEKTEEYIKQKNKENPDNKIAIFEIIIAATLKAIRLRPHMNRFIANKTMYQRNELTAAFTVKKNFRDDGEETLARVVAEDGDTLDTINKKVVDQINFCKTGTDESSEAMNFIQKLPGKKFIGVMARMLDRHGLMPKSVIATDPYQCTVVLTNLGSIGMNIGYHHLMNWGTTSIFIVIGKKHNRPHYDKDGNITMRREMSLSITIDERISDGFYYARSLRLLKKLIENPELLELPIEEEVKY
ncbi:2-oxoacid dehydrogenases acyltransferase (catalytic domain) [Lachnospiraceae bacterium YSD2013]|nr:2-oxoacid dehydrogenases acyltransferase (catalytic domain) [Lachnospiraceae bacterium YSD2013]